MTTHQLTTMIELLRKEEMVLRERKERKLNEKIDEARKRVQDFEELIAENEVLRDPALPLEEVTKEVVDPAANVNEMEVKGENEAKENKVEEVSEEKVKKSAEKEERDSALRERKNQIIQESSSRSKRGQKLQEQKSDSSEESDSKNTKN